MSALWALAAFVMTLAGGAFAFRYRRYLLYIMAASAGLLIGVAFLDLIPEVVELAHQYAIAMRSLMITVILGFVASFLDGLAIGVGFEAGPKVGFIVLLAVVAHDFADGLNTVTFMLATRNSRWRTCLLLGVDALAPVAGALCAGRFRITPYHLAFQLSFFAGFLLYLGA